MSCLLPNVYRLLVEHAGNPLTKNSTRTSSIYCGGGDERSKILTQISYSSSKRQNFEYKQFIGNMLVKTPCKASTVVVSSFQTWYRLTTDPVGRYSINFKLPLFISLKIVTLLRRQQQHQQPFNGFCSATTRVGLYQKKHSPTHTHPDHRTAFNTFLHLQRSSLRVLQSSRTTSF